MKAHKLLTGRWPATGQTTNNRRLPTEGFKDESRMGEVAGARLS